MEVTSARLLGDANSFMMALKLRLCYLLRLWAMDLITDVDYAFKVAPVNSTGTAFIALLLS
jgi:hypothetical protein